MKNSRFLRRVFQSNDDGKMIQLATGRKMPRAASAEISIITLDKENKRGV